MHFARACDVLRPALMRERASLGTAVMRLARATWDEADDRGYYWAGGRHVSVYAPALAAVLLGDAEGEGADAGVALPPPAVSSVVNAVAAVMARPSSTGSYTWCVLTSVGFALGPRHARRVFQCSSRGAAARA